MKHKLIKFLLPICFAFTCFGFTACEDTPDTPLQLTAPAKLQITDDILSWDKVENAEDYGVYTDGIEYLTAECRFDLSGFDQTQIYKIEVVAYCNDGNCRSEGSEIIYVGMNAPATEGLEFSVRSSDCIVKKFTVDENGVCILPETYQGKEIRTFSQKLSEEDVPPIKVLYLPSCMSDYTLGNGRNLMFYRFTSLETVYIRGGSTGRFIGAGNGIVDTEENAFILGGTKSYIPDDVTKIGKFAYAGRELTTFTVPDNIVEIETGAFRDCTLLEHMTFPAHLSMEKIGGIFTGCTSLKEIALPSGIIEMDSTFSKCTSLTKAAIPDGVTSMNGVFAFCTALEKVSLPQSIEKMKWAFMGCSSLQSIEIPKSVQSLDIAFAGCTSLKSVTVPGSVKELNGTFALCTSLKKVVLEEGVEVLAAYNDVLNKRDYYAFQQCIALTSVSLPSSLTMIKAGSFEGCISLRSIMIPENTTAIGPNAFASCPLYNVFYKGTEAEWNEKLRIEEQGNETLLSATRYYYSEAEPTEAGNFWHYVDGKPVKWAE